MPEGLLFRGKYVGKRKQDKTFNYASQKTVNRPSEVGSVPESAKSKARKLRNTATNNTLACPTTVVGGDRPLKNSGVLKTPTLKNQMKIFMPEEYLKHCGFKYDPHNQQVLTQNHIRKLIKTRNQEFEDPQEESTGNRFNEQISYKSSYRSQGSSNHRILRKRNDLDNLSKSKYGTNSRQGISNGIKSAANSRLKKNLQSKE